MTRKPGVALAKQDPNQLTAVIIEDDKRIHVTWEVDDGNWQPDYPFGDPVFSAPPDIAMDRQNDDQLTAAAGGKNGQLYVAWVEKNGTWHGPDPQGTAGVLPPNGAPVALGKLRDGQVAAVAIGHDKRMCVAWETEDGWQGPVPFGDAVFSEGSPVGIARQSWTNQATALAVGEDGRMWFALEPAKGSSSWDGPYAFGDNNTLAVGSGVAVKERNDKKLTALAVGQDGRMYYTWETDNKTWQKPVVAFGHEKQFPTNAGVAAENQSPQQLTAVAIGNDGKMYYAWQVGDDPWQGPVALGGALFEPGSGIGLAWQNEKQLTAMAMGKDGHLYVAWETNNGPWQGPKRI
ncbi:hypothetical protein [Saccharopolyspora spinosa]|uniref:Uncharacterized protein n=1 Tax=Saccharopolyspora spinosa TaxID=60894 RepID=A0A2N3Y6D6_SACSN|nr:hypothetical protein [Saccharopolyspora spinosa]PKW18487.1 hypothetical protein A8926_6576 [Saccharopolyspora spinosa]